MHALIGTGSGASDVNRACRSLQPVPRWLQVLAAALPMAASTPTLAADGGAREETLTDITPSHSIQYDASTGRLSAAVEDADFDWVLAQLREQAHVEFVVHQDDYGGITAHFESLPLAEGLRRLLAATNHMILGDEASNRVIVISRIDEAAADTRAPVLTARPAGPPEANFGEPERPTGAPALPGAIAGRTREAAMMVPSASPEGDERLGQDTAMSEDELAALEQELMFDGLEFELDDPTREALQVLENLPEGADISQALEDVLRESDTGEFPEQWLESAQQDGGAMPDGR
jgi:hypothetical protein